MFKQYALLFSRVAVPGLEFIKTGGVAAELEWLQEQGIVFGPQYSGTRSSEDDSELKHSLKLEMEQMWKLSPKLLADAKAEKD